MSAPSFDVARPQAWTGQPGLLKDLATQLQCNARDDAALLLTRLAKAIGAQIR
ncbi:hypothetical protein SAMN05519103_08594 [Rhizobiales bacterium GAS113]|nr:hypothetical protein SAMN05519103_08594 [Rhizobiales bacterium GAS113]